MKMVMLLILVSAMVFGLLNLCIWLALSTFPPMRCVQTEPNMPYRCSR